MNKNSYALVTGASSGIGTEIARQLAAMGHPLVITARRTDRLEELKKEIEAATRVKVWVVSADLADPAGASSLFDAVAGLDIQVGILVNNAGFGMQGYFLEMDPARLHQMCSLNINALTELSLLFGREMARTGGGYILQVASAVAQSPSPMVSAYAGTKAYVMAFSETLRYELKRHGISLTTLYPGMTTTEFNQVANAATPGIMRHSILSAEQVARIGLRAMFRRRRSVIPGTINKVNAFFSKVLPRGMVIHIAGRLMEKANR